jgi:hypothetical protein
MSIMPSCKDVTEHASEYLDHNMPLMKRVAFRMHLFICDNCARYLSQLKLTIATLGKIEEAVPQPIDDQKVQAIVENLKKQPRNPS